MRQKERGPFEPASALGRLLDAGMGTWPRLIPEKEGRPGGKAPAPPRNHPITQITKSLRIYTLAAAHTLD